MLRYYELYSKKSRGLRKKAGTHDEVRVLIDSDISRKVFRKNWARLIQKVYNVDFIISEIGKNTKIYLFQQSQQMHAIQLFEQ